MFTEPSFLHFSVILETDNCNKQNIPFLFCWFSQILSFFGKSNKTLCTIVMYKHKRCSSQKRSHQITKEIKKLMHWLARRPCKNKPLITSRILHQINTK